jgi:hypothetical protein
MKLLTQKGFIATSVVIVVVVLLVIGAAGYYVYHVHVNHSVQNSSIDVHELGIKLNFPDANNWTYTLTPDAESSQIATFNYKGWGRVGKIVRFANPPSLSDPGHRRLDKHIGNFYISLMKFGCPCSTKDEQYFAQLNTAFNTATAD